MTAERHVLKIQDCGDHYLKQVRPQIRLQGQWLLKAGLVPEGRVEVLNPHPGILVLRIIKARE